MYLADAGRHKTNRCTTGFSEVYRPANKIRLAAKPPGGTGKVSGSRAKSLVSDMGTPAVVGAVVV